MRRLGIALLATIGSVGGCRLPVPGHSPAIVPTTAARHTELPQIQPVRFEPSDHTLPTADLATSPMPKASADGTVFRGVMETEAQCLAAQNASLANVLDEENQASVLPRRHARGNGAEASASLQRQIRAYTALELRNRAAGDTLDRFFQLADAEARTALLRDAMPVVDQLRELAKQAKTAKVRYPIEPDDAERQRSQLLAQVEQADAGIRMLNIDLRRRIGLAWVESERLWPTGNFEVGGRVDEEEAVKTALADRPELRGWRAMEAGLTTDTLPAVRDLLRTTNPMLGGSATPAANAMMRFAMVLCRRATETSAETELAARRQQVRDMLVERERAVADETRAAVVSLNSQIPRIALARGRELSWKARQDDAKKQRDANIIGADLLEAQATFEWLKARAEVVTEVMAWHQARVRLKAAQGRLAWECAPEGFDPAMLEAACSIHRHGELLHHLRAKATR